MTSVASSRPITIDLFAGAGGISLGVEQAGYDTVFAIDNDPVAIATLNQNRKRFFPRLPHLEPQDITKVNPVEVMHTISIDAGDLDLLVGGPPCVAFSKSGFHLDYKREGKDSRASLLDDYLRFLDVLRPRAYMMENVFGLAYRNHSAPFFDRLVSGIRALGYSISYEVLNAADYGVPQNRQRLFLIGSRDGRKLRHPAPTHWGDLERRARPAGADRLMPHFTAGEALAGLEADPEPEEVVNGKYGHLLSEIPPGGNYLHYTEEKGHPTPQFKWRSRYWTFLLKLDPDRPSSTIQSQPGPYVGPFHWDNRRLRASELKRLQGFPDEYQFVGNRRQVQVQVGNSVPPPLSFAVAIAIEEQMNDGNRGPTENEDSVQLRFLG